MADPTDKAFAVDIIYEDQHLLALNKPNNLLVQPGGGDDTCLQAMVRNLLISRGEKEPFLEALHRLERPASGVVLFARNGDMLHSMNELFRVQQVRKKYWAIVKNRPRTESETLVHYLVFNQHKNKSYVFDNEVRGSRQALMRYRLMAQSDHYYLLEVDLFTGRHHQIRAQLSKIGCPVRGDLKYGFARSNPGGGISLHARSLSFQHPADKKELSLVAHPPRDTLWLTFLNMNLG
jgi:23S rRNA pseudouridine1911/1915/1917 synthase